MSAEGKNLEAISRAIVRHNGNCPRALVAILMNPHEVERLGWDEFMGIPIRPDESQGTGSFHLLCEADEDPVGTALEDAVAGEPVPVKIGVTEPHGTVPPCPDREKNGARTPRRCWSRWTTSSPPGSTRFRG